MGDYNIGYLKKDINQQKRIALYDKKMKEIFGILYTTDNSKHTFKVEKVKGLTPLQSSTI